MVRSSSAAKREFFPAHLGPARLVSAGPPRKLLPARHPSRALDLTIVASGTRSPVLENSQIWTFALTAERATFRERFASQSRAGAPRRPAFHHFIPAPFGCGHAWHRLAPATLRAVPRRPRFTGERYCVREHGRERGPRPEFLRKRPTQAPIWRVAYQLRYPQVNSSPLPSPIAGKPLQLIETCRA